MTSLENLLTLKIITPEGMTLEKDQLTSINVRLSGSSPIGIRPGHAPLIAETAKGHLKYRDASDIYEIDLYAGVLEVRNNQVTILTAGEMNKIEGEGIASSIAKYDRLMQTLIEQVFPQDDPKNEQI